MQYSFLLCVTAKCVKWIEQKFYLSFFLWLFYEWLSLFSILTGSLWSPFRNRLFSTRLKLNLSCEYEALPKHSITHTVLLDDEKNSSLVHSSHR